METHDPHTRAPIIAAFSPESAAREPLEFAHAASRMTDAPFIVVTVKHMGPLVKAVGGDVPDRGDERTLEHLRLSLDRRGLRDVEIRVFEDRTAARGLARALDELSPELIVLGSSRRGAVGAVMLGSTADRVLHTSSCPVAIVPNGYERPEHGVRVIGAAYAPTPQGREALSAAATLARAAGAQLRVIAVIDRDEGATQATTEVLEAVAELAEGTSYDVDVRVDDAVDGLVAASRVVDLLVMGSRALGPKRAVLLGSVSRRVAARAACPLLVLPRGATDKTEALLADALAHAAARG
jgi:nucleotide-binding universal stress UspA family protein